jgi:hypothetical protein
MTHEAADATIAVRKRMNEIKAVMRGGNRHDAGGLA